MRRIAVGVVVATVGLGLSGHSSAQATTRPACGLVTDATTDTTQGAPPATVPTDEPSLDIVSADVAVNAAWVTTAIRVKKLTLGRGALPDMWRWSMSFTAGSVSYMVHARTGEGGVVGQVNVLHWMDPNTDSWAESGVPVRARVTLDEQRSEIRVTVARSALADSGGVGIGERLSTLRAYSWHEHTAYMSEFTQPGGEWDIADRASSPKTYVAGARSCLKPGS